MVINAVCVARDANPATLIMQSVTNEERIVHAPNASAQ